MKTIFITIFAVLLVIGCGSPTSRMVASLDDANSEQTYSSMPPIQESIVINFYSTDSNEQNVYHEIIKLINEKSNTTKYKASTEYFYNKLSKSRQYKIRGLSTTIINRYALVFQYRNGHVTQSSIATDSTTKTEFPISIQITDKKLLEQQEEEHESVYQYTVKINKHEIQKSLRGIPPYPYIDSDERLSSDIQNILSSVQSASERKANDLTCSVNNKLMTRKHSSINIKMNSSAESYQRLGAFSIKIINTDFCKGLSSGYYTFEVSPSSDFKIIANTNPEKIFYKEITESHDHLYLTLDYIAVKLRKILESQKLPINFDSSQISFNINSFKFFGDKLEVSISASNYSNDYINTERISLHIGDKILTAEHKLNLPPKAKTIKDTKIIFLMPKDLKSYLDSYIENGQTNINMGISSQYSINGQTLSMFKEKNVLLTF